MLNFFWCTVYSVHHDKGKQFSRKPNATTSQNCFPHTLYWRGGGEVDPLFWNSSFSNKIEKWIECFEVQEYTNIFSFPHFLIPYLRTLSVGSFHFVARRGEAGRGVGRSYPDRLLPVNFVCNYIVGLNRKGVNRTRLFIQWNNVRVHFEFGSELYEL